MSPATGVLSVVAMMALTSCSSAPPTVTVSAGGQSEVLSPTQYCLDGEAEFYPEAERPPVLRVAPDEQITIEVSEGLAESGWQVQVFDEALEEQLGQVPVGNLSVFDGISTSDAQPPAYFLVIVEDAGSGCEGLSGAWPIGFVRDG
ncbi:MAG: DUF2771 family protein [Geodermatophilaceae bacterium]|nr:DUF2771 family protein [Geodermatophilaceae bacterium]